MMKKNSENWAKTHASALTTLSWRGVFVIVAFLSGVATSRADTASSMRSFTCGQPARLSLILGQHYEQVAIQQSGVVCVFRNKIEGFPTITITEVPRFGARTAAQRVDDVAASYRSVGLTDAVASNPRNRRISGLEALELDVRYTSKGEAIEALVALIEAPDRTYTATALFRVSGQIEEKKSVVAAVEGLEILGIQSPEPKPSSHLSAIWFVILVIAVAVLAAPPLIRRWCGRSGRE